MKSEETNYTPEFKKEVAQKALDQSKQNLDQLSEKYDVPVSVILMWATELEKGGEEFFEPSEEANEHTSDEGEVDVEIGDSRVADSVEHGVMLDQLNYKRLTFWSVLGVILVLIFVQGLYEMYQYSNRLIEESVSAESQYYQVNELKQEARQKLNSFGVVDLENGVYRIPIDSAINEVAADQ